jgi:hypothetical protein
MHDVSFMSFSFLPRMCFLGFAGSLLLFLACSGGEPGSGSSTSSSSGGNGGAADGSTPIDPDAGNSTDGASTTTIVESLERRGFALGNGSFDVIDITQCCQTNCSGNNPTSPYAAFYVPPAPGQTTPEANPRPDGKSNAYRLRADEAIVFVGKTAPKAAYFGFTPYLMDRDDNGTRKPIFASLAETLNDDVIATSAAPGAPPFEQTTAIIAAADATTVLSVTDALVEGGVAKSAINTLIFDPAKAHFGLEPNADTFGVLFRLALVEDAAKRKAFLDAPGGSGGSVWRVTPKAPAASAPLAAAAPRTKSTDDKELALRPAVQRLSDAISAAYPTFVSQPVLVIDGEADPNTCIEKNRFCAGDNRDTNYPLMAPRDLFPTDDDFYVVFGVDHQVSGKTTYANFSVYAVEHLVGIASIASDQYPGSAQRYLLPTDPDAPKLYAWKIARACNGEMHCLEIPKGACPTGIDNGAMGLIAFRTYLEPTTKTAPDMATLVRDRILRFRKP